MSTPRAIFTWSSRQAGAAEDVDLGARLAPLVGDRASSAAELVREASEALLDWLHADDARLGPRGPGAWAGARALLERELDTLREAHGWRGPVAGWLATLSELVAAGERGEHAAPPRGLLAEELGLWLGGEGAGEEAWSGAPLAAGRRLPERALCTRGLLGELERGEVILVHGWSETVALALEEVQQRGLAPEVVVSESSPDLSGRRLALRLLNHGARVRLIYDAALVAAVGRADRVWLGSEAIGAHGLVARVGTAALLEEARRRDVPSAVLATSDKLLPGGELALPAWGERDGWLLWERAPEGVRVDSQCFEVVPLDLPDAFATEHGRLSAAELALRALRTR